MTETPQQPQPSEVQHVHFLGIGGVGVSGLARIFLARGYHVSGTDAKDLPVMHELEADGAQIFVGYSADNLDKVTSPIDLVVASSVATSENPERQAAEAAGIPVLHRSEGLAHLMIDHKVLAVAGTHGKTTTSSMAATVLTEAGLEPSYAVGAAVSGLGPNARHGAGEWLVAEADESDGSLVNYTPDIAIVTNIEADHLDHYGTEEAIYQVFDTFANGIRPDTTDTNGKTVSALIVCADDPGARGLGTVQQLRHERGEGAEVLYYGSNRAQDSEGLSRPQQVSLALEIINEQPGIAEGPAAGQEVTYRWEDGTTTLVKLAMPGHHNALNAAAVLLAACHMGVDPEVAARGLARFQGSARRFEFHGDVAGIRVFDDYAHHPTEVSAAISAARTQAAGSKVHVIFQPHLFSRTRNFADDFAKALSLADTVRVLEIYPAREEPIPGVTSELITSQLSQRITARYPLASVVASPEEAVASIVQVAVAGDIVLTLGAGDITEYTDVILERLKAKHG